MAVTIIVKDGKPRGETRSSLDEKFLGEWGSTSFRNEEDAEKCKFVERQLKKKLGMDECQVSATVLNRIGQK